MNRWRALWGDKFSQGVLWNIVSLGIAGVGGVAVNYLVGQVYGAAGLGVFNQVYAGYIVMSQLAVLGVHSSVLTHVAASTDGAERRAIVTSALPLTFMTALAMCALFAASAHPLARLLDSPEVAEGILWATPGLLCFALNKVILAALNGLQRMRAYAIFQAGRVVFMALGFVGCVLVHAGRATLPVILTIGELVTLVLSIGTIADHLGRTPRAALRRWTGLHLRFGVRGFLSGLFGELNTRIDVLILGYFVSDALVGAYSLAAMIAEGVYQVLIALRTNYAPVVVRLLGESADELVRTVRRVRNRVYVAALVFATIAALGYALVVPRITHDPELQRSWIYFAVLLAGMVLSSGYVPFNQILLWARRPGWHTIMIVVVVATSALANVALVARFGTIGAACATAATYAFSVVLLQLFVARVLRLRI